MYRIFISISCIISLCVQTTAYAFVPGSMPNGGVAVINSSDCTETDYPASSNTNIDRGNALMSAVNAIKTGGDSGLGLSNQSVYLTPGIFDIGSNYIDLSEGGIRGVLSHNNLHGAGETLSTITSTIHGPNSRTEITPGINSQVTDLTINANSQSDYEFPFGIGQGVSTAYGTVYLKNVKIGGSTDGIYFNTGSSINLNVINVSAITSWDTIAFIAGSITFNVYNSSFEETGQSGLTASDFHGINDRSASTMNIYGSTFNVGGRGNTYGILSGGNVQIYNSSIQTTDVTNQPGPTLFDLYNQGGTIAVSPSVTYDGLKTFGAISNISDQTENVPSLPAESCPNPFPTIPTVQTAGFSDTVLSYSANVHATLSATGGATTTVEGFNYGTSTSYGSTVSTTSSAFGLGDFSLNISGLQCGTTYNYQGFATNAVGTATTTNQVFTTVSCPVTQTMQSNINTGLSSYSSGGSVSVSQLAAILAPSPATTAYIKSRADVLSTCPVGMVCIPDIASSTDAHSSMFTRTLSIGDVGTDVQLLQRYLNNHGFIVSESGDGSPGQEIPNFGPKTKRALIDFQKANEIPPTGFFGHITQAFVSEHV